MLMVMLIWVEVDCRPLTVVGEGMNEMIDRVLDFDKSVREGLVVVGKILSCCLRFRAPHHHRHQRQEFQEEYHPAVDLCSFLTLQDLKSNVHPFQFRVVEVPFY